MTCSVFQEGQDLLSGAKLDPDATTRGQQKKLDEIAEESTPAKKPRMAKGVTMAATAKVHLELGMELRHILSTCIKCLTAG